jgi:predicted RecB family nuclease
MTTRHDVSTVPLQGGYVAKQCPVRAQNDTIHPTVPLDPSPIIQRRWAKGREFEADVVLQLLDLHTGVAVVARGQAQARVTATSQAMTNGSPLIIAGRLPADQDGRRVGEPDLLVSAVAGGYRAIDIKHHRNLELTEPPGRGLPGLCSELGAVSFESARLVEASARKRREDLLQLAHYQRMLEAAGLSAPDARWGGIIGVECRVVWYDLDAPIWRTPSSSAKQKMRTTMEIYDFEFDFRLDIIAVAQQHMRDPATDVLLVPVKVGECGECPWWDYCGPQLEAGSGDVSLIARVGWREWKAHHDRGVTDRAALAALDVRTAQLIVAGVDVAALLEVTEGLPPETPITDLPAFGRRPAQVAQLLAAGIATAGDVSGVDALTATYSDAGLSSLPEQVDRARASLGPAPAYRRRGVDQVSAPRGDVEIDVDMENVEDGVYLWGALLTDRSGALGAQVGYRPFVTWGPMTPDAETANFQEFWSWLTTIRERTSAAGLTFRAYCYNASAENTYLRSIGAAAGVAKDVAEFIASEDWVDMLKVFDTQLMTGGGSGLKLTAPLAGFSWDVESPGGEESMLRYEVAVDEGSSDQDRATAREWLLTYNRGDVEATLALRDWLEGDARSLPSLEAFDA